MRYNFIKNTVFAAALLLGLAIASRANVSAAEIPAAEAAGFGKLLVQTSSGRVSPMNTYSSELIRKIYRKNNFPGQTPEQSFLRILSAEASVREAPIIYVSDKSIRQRFHSQGKHVAYKSLFDSRGNYILATEMDNIYSKAPGERSKGDKELIKLDEKANILYTLFNGGMMNIFPADNGWLTPGDDLSNLAGQDSLFVAGSLQWYLYALNEGDLTTASQVRGMIDAYQKAKITGTVVSDRKINAEIFYNNTGFFRWAFRLYLILGAVLLFTTFSGRRETVSIRILTASIFAVFLWQGVGMGLRWYVSARGPWANTYETMVYVGWITVLAGLIFSRRSPLVLALGTLMGGVILFVSNLSWLDPQITPLVPVLKSPWLMIHVSVITASYGFFGICALAGITSMILLLGGKINRDLRRVNEMSMIIGLALLTIGIFFGAIWANESWGRYWGWDPKETWALITMIVYALITHSRFIPGLNNYFAFNAMSAAAILSVLMTFFGVNYYLSGLHSYGNSGMVSSVPVFIAVCALGLLILLAGIKYRKLVGNKLT